MLIHSSGGRVFFCNEVWLVEDRKYTLPRQSGEVAVVRKRRFARVYGWQNINSQAAEARQVALGR
jgi:hypothetical protein